MPLFHRSTFGLPRLPLRLILAAVLGLALLRSGRAAPSGLVELTENGRKHQGRLEAKGSDVCWLLGRDGRLSPYEVDRIQSIRASGPRFHECSLAELRDQLRRELPKDFRIDATGHFLICAEKGNRRIGEVCEETYRTFRRYFSVRGFRISEPAFPLVVIVFPDRGSFIEYAQREGIHPPHGMLGYYMRLSNRIALFDNGEKPQRSALAPAPGPSFASIFSPPAEVDGLPTLSMRSGGSADPPFDAMIEADLQNTLVHETTHQVAFNTGLHSRLGQTPKWVIEGLATMFEAPGIRDSQKNASPKSRINRGRFIWFQNYVGTRRPARWLEDFVASDEPYSTATLDAYAEGWALTFFLSETRHGSYARYLKSIAQRSALKVYGPDERVADFRKAFGNLESLETDYLRFYAKLK